MADPLLPEHQRPITDPLLRQAVEHIDAGDADALRSLLDEHPHLATARVEDTHSPFLPDMYFARPTLLHFTAENPVRHGKLPADIGAVIDVLLEAGAAVDAGAGPNLDGTTLGLFASGKVPREAGVQVQMINKLVAAGADPKRALDGAVFHGETDAIGALLQHGGASPIECAAGLGRIQKIRDALEERPSDTEKINALRLAALMGQVIPIDTLKNAGVDLDATLLWGGTAAHLAAQNGDRPFLERLAKRGADFDKRDENHGGTPADWASGETANWIRELAPWAKAVRLIHAGRVDELESLLTQHPGVVTQRVGAEQWTLLHIAGDWPGHFPNIAASIRLLVAAGADVNEPRPGSFGPVSPIHGPASTDDVEALDALLDAGADIEHGGGMFTSGPPLSNAVIFQLPNVTARLLQRGAKYDLVLAAGAGRLDLIEPMFDGNELHADAPSVPGLAWDGQPLRMALWLSAQAGHAEVVKFLLDRGADTTWVGPENETALQRAERHGHAKTAELLRGS
ncbi:MAG: ankyrin repeat domain-containing protein [Planctomycetota bacterium]